MASSFLHGQDQLLINRDWTAAFGEVFRPEWSASEVDGNGNIFTLGNTVTGGGKVAVLLHKRHSDGTVVWESSFVATGVEAAYGIALTLHESGHIYVAGARLNSSTFKHEILVVKYNASGTVLWHTAIPGSGGDEFATAITVDGAQRIFVTGASQSVTDGWDMLTAGLTSSGQVVWTRRYDYAQKDDAPVSIWRSGTSTVEVIGGSMDASGKWGVTSVKYLLNGTPGTVLRQDTLRIDFDRPFDFHLDPNGAYYLAGVTPEEAGYRFLTVNKFNTDLSKDWMYYHVEGTTATMGAVAVSPAGEVYVTGEIQMSEGASSKRLITLKLDTAGALDWQRRVSPQGNAILSRGGAVSLSPNGNLLVAAEEGDTDNSRLRLRWYDGEGVMRNERWYEGTGQGRLQPRQVHHLGDTTVWVSAIKVTTGLGKYHTIKYELHNRNIAYTLSQDSIPLYVSGDVIIRFSPTVLDTNWINDKSQNWGHVADIVTDTSLVNQMDQVLGAGGNLSQWILIRIFNWFDTQKTTATSRSGETVKIPDLWSAFVLEIGEAVVKEPFPVSEALDSLPYRLLRYAHPNYASISLSPNDLLYGEQESLDGASNPNADINMEPAWDIIDGDWSNVEQVRVGLFDTGVNFRHEDFTCANCPGIELSGGGNSIISSSWQHSDGPAVAIDPDEDSALLDTGALGDNPEGGHGTNSAGIISAIRNNNTGIAGIAGGDFTNSHYNGVEMHSYMYTSIDDEGNIDVGSLDKVAGLLEFASIDQNDNEQPAIDIACLEYQFDTEGLLGRIQEQTELIIEAHELIYELDIISLTARGNFGNDDPSLPACLSDHRIMSIGASGTDGEYLLFGTNTEQDTETFSSSYGGNLDLIAPGTNALVHATRKGPGDNTYGAFNGTSAALPHATGVAVLIMGHHSDRLAQEDIEKVLEYTATDISGGFQNYPPGYDERNGWGRLDSQAALELIDPDHDNLRVIHFEIENPVKEEISGLAAFELLYGYDVICDAPASGDVQGKLNRYYADIDVDLSAYEIQPANFSDPDKKSFWTRSGGSHLWMVEQKVDEQGNPIEGLYEVEPGNHIKFDDNTVIQNNRLQGTIFGYTLDLVYICGEGEIDEEAPILETAPTTLAYGGEPRLRFSVLAEVPSDFDEELPIIITSSKEVKQINPFAATVFPNPAENQFKIGAELQKAGRVTLSLFSASGSLLMTQNKTAFSPGWNYWDISLEDFSAGLYLLRLQTDEGVSTLKIVKQ